MKNNYAKRTDASQKEVVDTLRKHGWQVLVTNYGESFPDLLIGKFGKWMLLEVKEESGSLTRGQLEFLTKAHGPVDVVTTGIEATNAQGITINQLVNVYGWLQRNPEQQSLSLRKFKKLISG